MINIEVSKNSNENNTSLIRRFTKRVQGAGILPRVRGIRFHERDLSHFKKKRKTLNAIERKAKYDELVKLGKVQPRHNS